MGNGRAEAGTTADSLREWQTEGRQRHIGHGQGPGSVLATNTSECWCGRG